MPHTAAPRLILDHVHAQVDAHPDQVFMTQPLGGGAVQDITWGQMLDASRRMAAHLQSLNFAPGSKIAMLAKNSAHFIMAELAIWMAGHTTVAIFPTESAANVRYVLDHSEASLLFVGKLDTWAQQQSAVPPGLPRIALPLSPATGLPAWDDIVARHAPLPGRPQRAASDIAMLLYTSGSTGQPKGVMQTFGSISAATQALLDSFERSEDPTLPSRVLSYLPLAHAYERACVMCVALMRQGPTQVFFTESLSSFMDDLKRARPTFFCSVPRLWTKFQQGVLAAMPAAQLDTMLADPKVAAVVRHKVLASIGLDHCTHARSGSAPIPVALLEWYQKLGLNLLEGYGMTEDFCVSHRCTNEANAPGFVGLAYPEVQARLDVDGEVLVKSPGTLAGYYKRPDLDAEVFTEDGFFRTGDLGFYDGRGMLKITGRKKELFKTAKGKFVAPAPIENLLNAHAMVELSMVSGVGREAAYAMVVLDEALRAKLHDAAVRERVQAELATLLHSVNEGLAGHERLRMLVVAREPWSIDNGCLTPTMKIKRSRIEATVDALLDDWYATPAPVLWQ
jgi:long-chain acyl-CoA synthetase